MLSVKMTAALKKAAAILPPLLLIGGNVFIFCPAAIIAGNVSEIRTDLIGIIPVYLMPVLLAATILGAIGFCLPEKSFSPYLSILTAIGVLLWIQGSLLVWDMGLIGAGDLNWNARLWRGWIDSALWVATLFLFTFQHRRISRFRPFLVGSLLLLQTVHLGLLSFQQPAIWRSTAPPRRVAPAEIFQFSKNRNVIHVILDELGSPVFQDLIHADPARYSAVFEGFTFFKNTTGSFPKTEMSLPAIISGNVYKNDIPKHEYLNSIFTGQTIANTLHANRYDVDIACSYGSDWHRLGKYTRLFGIPIQYGGTQQQLERLNANELVKLSFFRSVPFFFKKTVYNKKLIRNRKTNTPIDTCAAIHLSNRAFFRDVIDKMSIPRTRPVYKFFHLLGAHWPIVFNGNGLSDGRILAWTWPNIHAQARCSVDQFAEFIQKLKTMGIYDSALIILQGDHGVFNVPDSARQIPFLNAEKTLAGFNSDNKEIFAKIVSSALPTLAIKRPNDKKPFRISAAPVTLSDIPATICAQLDIPGKFAGRPAFDLNEKEIRNRTFYYYHDFSRNNYLPGLNEFIIQGDPLDKNSWFAVFYSCAFTDENTWVNGFFRADKSRFYFIIPKDEPIPIKAGDLLKFAFSGEAKVIQVVRGKNGPVSNIFITVDKPLDPRRDGSPNPIVIGGIQVRANCFSNNKEWRNGIHLTKPGYFYFLLDKNEAIPVTVGNRVRFARSGEAIVRDVFRTETQNNSNIFVGVDTILDPEGDGCPNPIRILRFEDN